MPFNREALPEPVAYFEGQGITITGPKSAPWGTGRCEFHGGSDSLRIHKKRGAWICMACNAKGGDVLSYHMAVTGLDFVEAAKALGAWISDGKPHAPRRPTPLPANLAINVLAAEANLAAIAAANVGHGVQLTDQDRQRLLTAAGRITHISGAFA